jgi:predicted amidohydrolase YtcJ
MTTLIKSVRLFDGQDIHAQADVLVQDGKIVEVSKSSIKAPANARVVDGAGKTLLPGLIDAHVHAQAPALEQNILFGITTCLDMYSLPDWMDDLRKQAAENDDCADIRSASCGGTVMKVYL